MVNFCVLVGRVDCRVRQVPMKALFGVVQHPSHILRDAFVGRMANLYGKSTTR